MIKKLSTVLILLFVYLITSSSVLALEETKIELTPIPCNYNDANSCPQELKDQVYPNITPQPGRPAEQCAAPDPATNRTAFQVFQSDPTAYHYWVEDPDVTAQGKADERARQFIYWVLNKNAIDDHPVLRDIWKTTRNLAYFFLILVVAVMGIGIIVGQRSNFQINIKLWPSVGKIIGALIWITFSAAIVIFLIQMSELLMRFFIENLGGKNLFTIYFTDVNGQPTGTSEGGYSVFYGCRDLNIRVQEAARTEMFMLKATNITYYVMGIMLLLRKILLWFMLFVSPFLAILFPFVFIRNVGWIWIGVFFQWLFYGPLFALFLGGLSKIWEKGIPFLFDFTRVNNISGYIYPTAINLIYGGPAQQGALRRISALNNGNYVDTFAEYIITLIMLWAVIFFPWWLLRIFRDYCCDGIYAMKNILLSMYDQTRGGPQPPSPSPAPIPSFLKASIKMPKEVEVPVKIKLETIEEIKRTRTEDITKSLNLSATKLTDVARFETQKETKEVVQKNLNYLSNPLKAETPAERQKYMNLRTELFNRAIRDDRVAKQILSATTTSAVEKIQKREEILKSTPYAEPITHVVSVKVKLPQDKVTSVNNTLLSAINTSNQILTTIAQNTQITVQQVQQIITSFKNQMGQLKPVSGAPAHGALPSAQIVDTIARETGVKKETVVKVITHVAEVVKTNKEFAKEVSDKENIKPEQLEQIVETQVPAIAEPEKNVEKAITIPPSISIEDYEEVKKMWTQQYEQGEVPVQENITTRQEWVDSDVVTITNTLNKLLSSDEETRQQGLDDLGYILPIFLINNLKGEELLVYLKAKLEAAKEVKDRLFKEKEITERVQSQQKEEEFVEQAPAKKTEAEKTMTMEEELKMPSDEKNTATPLNKDELEKKLDSTDKNKVS